MVRDQSAPRLMAVNIDEDELGTFKGRTHLERDPHRFLEGVLIAAQVVGVEACCIAAKRPSLIPCPTSQVPKLSSFLPLLRVLRKSGPSLCGWPPSALCTPLACLLH
jgi:formate dehydrogenase beta subunit